VNKTETPPQRFISINRHLSDMFSNYKKKIFPEKFPGGEQKVFHFISQTPGTCRRFCLWWRKVEDLCHKLRAIHACIQILDNTKERILNTEKSQSPLHSAPVISPFLHNLILENCNASENTGQCQQFSPNPVVTISSRDKRFLLTS